MSWWGFLGWLVMSGIFFVAGAQVEQKWRPPILVVALLFGLFAIQALIFPYIYDSTFLWILWQYIVKGAVIIVFLYKLYNAWQQK